VNQGKSIYNISMIQFGLEVILKEVRLLAYSVTVTLNGREGWHDCKGENGQAGRPEG